MREEKSLRKDITPLHYFRENVCSLALTSSFKHQTLNTQNAQGFRANQTDF